MSTTRETLVDLHHPEFRRGYYQGRQGYFREGVVLTDKGLVELLQCIFEQSEQDEGPEREVGVYYSVGQMSGRVLPCQPYEDRMQEMQEAFLVRIGRADGTAGQTLVETIRRFWTIQDQLAQTLDTETFELVLMRGMEPRS